MAANWRNGDFGTPPFFGQLFGTSQCLSVCATTWACRRQRTIGGSRFRVEVAVFRAGRSRPRWIGGGAPVLTIYPATLIRQRLVHLNRAQSAGAATRLNRSTPEIVDHLLRGLILTASPRIRRWDGRLPAIAAFAFWVMNATHRRPRVSTVGRLALPRIHATISVFFPSCVARSISPTKYEV
jgi:hypothetical protein